MLDNKLKPWVLEVNHSPSFSCDSDLDKEIKSGVISGAMKLLNLSGSSQKKYQKQEKHKSQTRLWKKVEVKSETVVKSEPNLRRPSSSAVTPKEKVLPRAKSSDAHLNQSSSLIYLGRSTISPTSSTESIDGPKRMSFARLQKQQDLALEEYQARFDAKLLLKLDRFEDINMGNYQRIFPPNDHKVYSINTETQAIHLPYFGNCQTVFRDQRDQGP
jgi:Tubulin-tyrosine ligase family